MKLPFFKDSSNANRSTRKSPKATIVARENPAPKNTYRPETNQKEDPAQEARTEKKSEGKSQASQGSQTPKESSQTAEKSKFKLWEIKLSPSSVTTLLVILVVTVSFSFIFGLIVGSGYSPKGSRPQLEALMMEPQPNAETSAVEKVLSPEELRFMNNLKKDSSPSTASPQVPASTATPKPVTTATPDTVATTSAAPAKNSAPDADKQIFDFVIRAAAFKAEDQADTLRERLEGGGMRTRMVRDKGPKTTWYHVQVLFRGTQAAMEDVRSTLPNYGLKDSLIASKVPVN